MTYSVVQKKLERTSPKFNIGEQIATFRFGRKSREISALLFFNHRKITQLVSGVNESVDIGIILNYPWSENKSISLLGLNIQ